MFASDLSACNKQCLPLLSKLVPIISGFYQKNQIKQNTVQLLGIVALPRTPIRASLRTEQSFRVVPRSAQCKNRWMLPSD